MTSCNEKKELPPPTYTEQPPGGVFPEEIEKIKQEARGGNQKRKKIVIGVICAVLGLLLVVGLINLGFYLSKDPVVRRNLKFRDENKLYWETVETDTGDNTDTFYTESDNGAAAVMFDHNKDLKAYKFSGRDICYIVPEEEGEDEKAKEAARELENKEEGSTQTPKKGGRRKMSLDESRTDTPELSEAMRFFCGDLEPRWAILGLADSEEPSDGIALIGPDSPGDASAETDRRVRRAFLWGRRKEKEEPVVVPIVVIFVIIWY